MPLLLQGSFVFLFRTAWLIYHGTRPPLISWFWDFDKPCAWPKMSIFRSLYRALVWLITASPCAFLGCFSLRMGGVGTGQVEMELWNDITHTHTKVNRHLAKLYVYVLYDMAGLTNSSILLSDRMEFQGKIVWNFRVLVVQYIIKYSCHYPNVQGPTPCTWGSFSPLPWSTSRVCQWLPPMELESSAKATPKWWFNCHCQGEDFH